MKAFLAFLVLAFGAAAAPLDRRAGTPITGEWIVLLDTTKVSTAAQFEAHFAAVTASIAADLPTAGDFFTDSGIRRNYTEIGGYSGKFSSNVVRILRQLPEVRLVEQDQVVTIAATQVSPPSWGLSRLSVTTRTPGASYVYPDTAGAGVDAYVIDTGILTTHTDFGGRAVSGYAAAGSGLAVAGDGQGHGTHVAGTIGGTRFGVAKRVNLIAVKVLGADGRGQNSWVVDGMNWVAAQRRANGRKCVVNMSLGGGASAATDSAAAALVNAGCVLVVAAGNEAQNACNVSPARAASAITVAASTSTDGFASYSNFGSCVDIIAPGSSIVSTYRTSTTSTATLSGTSMASPHVAGVAALVLGRTTAALSVSSVTTSIINAALTGRITGVPSGTVNRLLNTIALQ